MSSLGILHLVLMVAAFVVFSLSFIVSGLFLIQERQLKFHRAGPGWMGRLPALESMDRLHYRVLGTGFALLTLGILSGMILSKNLFGSYLTADPRQIASIVTWGIYILFLNVRIRPGWRGRRAMMLSVLGFLTVVLTFFGFSHRGI